MPTFTRQVLAGAFALAAALQHVHATAETCAPLIQLAATTLQQGDIRGGQFTVNLVIPSSPQECDGIRSTIDLRNPASKVVATCELFEADVLALCTPKSTAVQAVYDDFFSGLYSISVQTAPSAGSNTSPGQSDSSPPAQFTVEYTPDADLCGRSITFDSSTDYDIDPGQTGRLTIPLIYDSGVCRDDDGVSVSISGPDGSGGSTSYSCDAVVLSPSPDFTDPATRPNFVCDVDYSDLVAGEYTLADVVRAPEPRPYETQIRLRAPIAFTITRSAPITDVADCAASYQFQPVTVTQEDIRRGLFYLTGLQADEAFCRETAGQINLLNPAAKLVATCITVDGDPLAECTPLQTSATGVAADFPSGAYTAGVTITDRSTQQSSTEVTSSVDLTVQESPSRELCAASFNIDPPTIDISSTQTGRFQLPFVYGDSVCDNDYGFYLLISPSAASGQEYICDPVVLELHPDFDDDNTRPYITCNVDYADLAAGEYTVGNAPGSPDPQPYVQRVNIQRQYYTFDITRNGPVATGSFGRRSRQQPIFNTIVSNPDVCASSGRMACAISGATSVWECVDGNSDIEACGGCAGSVGRDCTAIDNVESVLCERGVCRVTSCEDDWIPSLNASLCLKSE